jgi:hypothetical protein
MVFSLDVQPTREDRCVITLRLYVDSGLAVKRRPRHIGLDEIQRGKGQRFWTVLSDVVHGEVMGLRQDRTDAAATDLLTEDLTARQRTHGHGPRDATLDDLLPEFARIQERDPAILLEDAFFLQAGPLEVLRLPGLHRGLDHSPT